MSTITTTTNKLMCDELFEDSDESDVLEKSWKKTVDGINKDGYRAGIDVGQEECLQEGFNEAFTISSKLLYTVSELRGHVSGKLSYNLMKPGALSPDQEQLLQTLLGDIVEYETELLKFSKELYSQIQQKSGCLRQTDGETGREGVTSTCDSFSVAIKHDEAKSDSGNCDKELASRSVEASSIHVTRNGGGRENETTVTSRISHFKTKLKEILASGT